MLIYLHGLEGNANGRKPTALKRGRRPYGQVVTPAVPRDPREAVGLVRDVVKRAVETAGEEVVLVGSSLGGYYALWASTELDLRRVLINQLVNVAAQWPSSLPMAPEDLRFLDSLRPAEGWPARDTLVLLDEGDTLLDRQVTLDELEGHAHVIMYPGGSHDFEHMEEAVEELGRFCRG